MNVPTLSTRPYLIRALYEWCTDNGFTPYVAVSVDAAVQVPREYVKDNEIVLNIGLEASNALTLGNEYIEFKARFGGKVREILVPISHVMAIYARENGQGMAFPLESGVMDMSVGGAINPAELAEAITAAASASVVSDTSDTVEGKIMKLVESASPADDSPEPPKTPPRPRPSLTRVK